MQPRLLSKTTSDHLTPALPPPELSTDFLIKAKILNLATEYVIVWALPICPSSCHSILYLFLCTPAIDIAQLFSLLRVHFPNSHPLLQMHRCQVLICIFPGSQLSHFKEVLHGPASVRFLWGLFLWHTHRLDEGRSGLGAFWIVKSQVFKKKLSLITQSGLSIFILPTVKPYSSDTEFESGLVIPAKNIYYVPDTELFPLFLWNLLFI